MGDRLAQQRPQPVTVPGCGDPHAGHDAEHGQVPHAVVRRAIAAGDAGPVQYEGDRQPVQRHVHEHLVEGPVEERGVDADHRVQPAHGEPGRGGHRVLFGDADVEDPVREVVGERVQPGRVQHGRGQRDHVRAFPAHRDQFVGEYLGPRRTGRLLTRRGHRADRVHAVRRVVLRRWVALALAGDTVHHDRPADAARLAQRGLHRVDVVPVHRTEVRQAERFEQVAGGAGPQLGEVGGERADGGGVGAAVVVEQDDDRPVRRGGDVVQRLPAHAAGERAVADHRDHRPLPLVAQGERLGQTIRIGQCGGGVRILHQIVLALRPGRVPGQAAALAQSGQVLPPGQQLVHVRLVPGVPHDGVLRRVEDPVHRDGQLNRAEIGPEVAAGARHHRDQTLADLGRQRGKRRGR